MCVSVNACIINYIRGSCACAISVGVAAAAAAHGNYLEAQGEQLFTHLPSPDKHHILSPAQQNYPKQRQKRERKL